MGKHNSRRITVTKSARRANVKALTAALNGLGSNQPQQPERNPPSPSAIRALRQLLGLHQYAMARQVGAYLQTVSNWETGRQAPAPRMTRKLYELAEANNLDLDKLTDPEYYKNHLRVEIFVDKGGQPA